MFSYLKEKGYFGSDGTFCRVNNDNESMSNEEALNLVSGDRVAFADESVQTRTVIKVEKLPNGIELVHTNVRSPKIAEAHSLVVRTFNRAANRRV